MNSQNSIYMDNQTFEELKDKALLVDVRTEVEFKSLQGIPGAQNIYIYDLLQDPSLYLKDKEQLIITLCNGGNRSSDAAAQLLELGYKNAFVLTHGIYGYYRWKNKQEK